MFKVDQDKCAGVAACVDVCPTSAISLQNGKAVIDQDECVECGSCEAECPTGAISEE